MTKSGSEKSILVTGASKGIGKAIALRVARAGFPVTVHYGQDHDGAATTLSAIKVAGGEGRILGFDVADRAATKAALDADIAEHGAYWGIVLRASRATMHFRRLRVMTGIRFSRPISMDFST